MRSTSRAAYLANFRLVDARRLQHAHEALPGLDLEQGQQRLVLGELPGDNGNQLGVRDRLAIESMASMKRFMVAIAPGLDEGEKTAP